MDFVRLWAFVLVTSAFTVWEIQALARRQKRDDLLFRRLESLSIRVENLEVDLRREQRRGDSLQAELNELKSRITQSEEKPQSRGGVGELSEAAVKKLSDLARKTFRADIDVLRSGMIAEKQRTALTDKAVEACKLSINRQSSRVDGIDVNMRDLDGRLTNLRTTIVSVNKTCSLCSAHASGKGSEVKSGKCPLFERFVTNKQTLRTISLGSAVCERQNFLYALYVTVRKIITSSDSESRAAEITVGAGIKIGDRQIYRNTRATVTLSRDCDWQNVQENKQYLILTDQALEVQGLRRTLSLKDSIILTFQYEGPPVSSHLLVRYTEGLLYHLRQGNWRLLCRE